MVSVEIFWLDTYLPKIAMERSEKRFTNRQVYRY